MLRLTVLLLLLALALGAGWWSLDRLADGEVRRQLALRGLDGLADYDRVVLDLPWHFQIDGIRLRDPADGRQLGELDHLDLVFATDPEVRSPVKVARVLGRGVRLVLVPDDTPEVLGISRSLIRLIDAIVDLVNELTGESAPGDPPVDLPPMEFHDIDLVVRSASLPLEHYPGTWLEIDDDEETHQFVTATIHLGGGGGELDLVFDIDEGLVRLAGRDMLVTTAIVQIIPEPWGTLLARSFRPSGRIHFVIEGLGDVADLALRGELHDAVLRPAAVALPLGPADVPFSMRDGRLRVEPVEMPYAGGSLRLAADGDEDAVLIDVSVRGARLAGALVGLLPDGPGSGPLRVSEQGRFDADLVLSGSLGGGLHVVSGQGGFHLESLTLVDRDIVIADVVGRFAVDEDDHVQIERISGLCAGGGFRGEAGIDLLARRFHGRLEVLDIDIARLGPPRRDGPTGWLQGSISGEGRLDAWDEAQLAGELSIRAGRFTEAPLVAELGGALTRFLGLSDRPRDTQRLEARFTSRGAAVQVEQLRLDIGQLVLAGSGRLGDDRRLSLELYLIDRAGLVSGFFSLLGQALVQVAVRGTLEAPQVDVYYGAVVTRPALALLETLVPWDL